MPQRRRRIALVVDFGGQRAGEILFEHTGVSGHLEPSIPPWKGIARNPAHGTAGHDRVVEGAGAYTLKIRSGCEGGGKGPLVQTEKSATLSTLQDQTLLVFRKATKPHSKEEAPRYAADEIASTLNTFDIGESRCNELVAFSKEAYNTGENATCSLGITDDKKAPTMRADTHPSGVAYWGRCVLRWIVRRLTPTECERLQGFPDGWTDIGEWYDSKGKRHKPADSPRYKALGNSIALPQWWWITCKMAAYLPEHATLGSLFDGIGGFPLVWETRHGKGTAVWASEIEEFPIAVTKRRFGE